jgi:hypothetical protein
LRKLRRKKRKVTDTAGEVIAGALELGKTVASKGANKLVYG